MKAVSWFSHGAPSAVAAKLALKTGAELDICYQATGSEHPDNVRFRKECEEWFGQPITVIRSDKYADTWDVFEKTGWLVGPHGARCTSELKRIPAERYLFDNYPVGTWEVFGFTVEEEKRVARYRHNNPERFVWPILLDRGYTKGDCKAVLKKVGIELPAMYRLGYRNNNCIGCVKGGSGYWNKIRVTHPETFARMAKLERKMNVAICKTEPIVNGKRARIPVFLDELDPKVGRYSEEPAVECGIFCTSEIEGMD